MKKSELKNKIYSGDRITREDALALFTWDLTELGLAADFRRKKIYPAEKVGFIVDRIINFTNKCTAECRFCAFHARGNQIPEYEMGIDTILEKARALKTAGGTQIMLQGGLHPEYTLESYVDMVKAVKAACPGISIHSFSPAELLHISRNSELPLERVITALKDAGLTSVPGASDLLVDRIRNYVSPNKISAQEWVTVMKALASHGLPSSATMTYGMGESLEERVEHLAIVRGVQDETGNLRAFIPWSFSPCGTGMENIVPASGEDYLRVIAIARIFLDNIIYFQAGWLTEGFKLAQIALAMGANDMGGVLMEEVVVKATGINREAGQETMIDIIRNAGKIAYLRDSSYAEIEKF